ncbi:MAG TPA: ribose 5-phosphate isomerase B [Acidobacteriota bacterium]|nr:ribose 5-phosphate isomerase B [Acidobacteriota bacterium]
MKVAVGADHKGYAFKARIKGILEKLGHEVIDFGTDSEESVDYPDFGLKVARAVRSGQARFGITVCWTGNGMNIAANKVPGIRAGMALSPDQARLTRLHNDANVLTIASKYTPESDLEAIVTTFLTTEFEAGRHVQRLEKIRQQEESAADVSKE